MTEQQILDEALGRCVRELVEKRGLFLYRHDGGLYLARNDFGMPREKKCLSAGLLDAVLQLRAMTV